MIPGLQVTGLVFAAISAVVSLGVAIYSRRPLREDSASTLFRAILPVSVVSMFFALGAGLTMVPRWFDVGELIVLLCGPAVPVIWAWLGHREIAEAEETPARSRRIFGLGVFAAVAVIVYLFVSRPVYSEGAWYIDPGTRWAFFILLVLGAWAMFYFERLYRWSAGQLRAKMRWLRLGLALYLTLWLLAAGEGFFWTRLHIWWLPALAVAQGASVLAAYRFLRLQALAELPLSLSRRAAYTSVVVIILGAYLLFLGVVGLIIREAGGDVETYISVLAAFLAVVLLSGLIAMPSMGRRIRQVVDRHLYKGRVDFTAEWARITDDISGILDLPPLVKTVANFLEEAFSDGVYIFLPVPGGGRFGLYYPFGHGFTETLPVEGESADWLWRLGEPIMVANWISGVENEEEKKFLTSLSQSLDGRIAVPLLARRRFLGFAVLGQRRDRPDYDEGDFEFLSAMSGPVAFAVLTGQVSEELLARREMESFNRLSTYVVHDLKNSISMLSMLLQNAENHIADPAFQKSALNTISNAVRGMEHLIGKISGGKDRLRPEPRPTDLNQMISEIAERAGLSTHPHLDFRFEPGEIPAALGDPMHIRRIIENLLINAVEAMSERGRLEVSTGKQNGPDGPRVWARVRDTGPGMTREFASTRLFKPFESTKKKGLGIGMYQVKEMIEADGGRIQLTSEPGKGTTFEVFWRTARDLAREEKTGGLGDELTARKDIL